MENWLSIFVKSNFWTIKTVFILVKVCIYVLYTRQCQSYYLMGAWLPETPTILFTYGWPKFETKSLNGCMKIMILRITSIKLTKKFSAHSAFLKQKQKTVGHQPKEKKYFHQLNVNKRALVLLQCSWSFLSQNGVKWIS